MRDMVNNSVLVRFAIRTSGALSGFMPDTLNLRAINQALS
tara:strand:+ start:8738 stop:8857 length:120 start_codon:yes stop_codon:yes gene_type:complete